MFLKPYSRGYNNYLIKEFMTFTVLMKFFINRNQIALQKRIYNRIMGVGCGRMYKMIEKLKALPDYKKNKN